MELQDLPDEVLLEIFARLPVHDMVKCALHVCIRWKTLLQKSGPWKGKEYKTENSGDMEDIVKLIQYLPHVKHLCIGSAVLFRAWFTGSYVYISCGVSQETLRSLLANPKIDRISIPKDSFTPQISEIIGVERKVKSLVISPSHSFNFSLEALSLLLQQRSLSELTVLHIFGGHTITDDILLDLCYGCPHLEELALHDLQRLTEKGLQNLKMCKKLRLLELTSCHSIRRLSFLPHCQNLQHLDLTMCTPFKASCYRQLLHLKKLKRFHLRHSNVADLPLKSMADELKDLELIDLLCTTLRNVRDLNEFKIYAPHVIVLSGRFDFTRH